MGPPCGCQIPGSQDPRSQDPRSQDPRIPDPRISDPRIPGSRIPGSQIPGPNPLFPKGFRCFLRSFWDPPVGQQNPPDFAQIYANLRKFTQIPPLGFLEFYENPRIPLRSLEIPLGTPSDPRPQDQLPLGRLPPFLTPEGRPFPLFIKGSRRFLRSPCGPPLLRSQGLRSQDLRSQDLRSQGLRSQGLRSQGL